MIALAAALLALPVAALAWLARQIAAHADGQRIGVEPAPARRGGRISSIRRARRV